MSEQIIKNKIVLLGLAALLLVSCGGGGGGSGSSNAPVNPGNNRTSPRNKVEDVINPGNSGNKNNSGNRTNPNVVAPGNNPTQNETRESLESLRARMDEAKVRKHILN